MYHIDILSNQYRHKQHIEKQYPVVIKNIYGNLVLDVHLPHHTTRHKACMLKHQLAEQTGSVTYVRTTDDESGYSTY